MKLLLILMMISLIFFQTIDTKPYRVLVDDNILPYIDKSVPFLTEYFSMDDVILEQIEDDNVQIGGFVIAKKSMDPNLPIIVNVRTQLFERATWNEAPLRMTLLNACEELIIPDRAWYNVTKLFTNCPILAGEKWEIESSQLNSIYNVPPTMPIVPWKIFVLVTQGLPGFEKLKFGYGIKIQFLPIS